VRNIAPRIAIGNTPWADYSSTRQRLSVAMKALGFDPGSEATWQVT